MLQHLNWHSLENRRTDAQFVIMYKITNENVAIAEEDNNQGTCIQCLSLSLPVRLSDCKT